MNLRGPLTLLNDSVSFYKSHFKSLLAIMLAPAVLFAVGSYLVGPYTGENAAAALRETSLVMMVVSGVLLLASIILGLLSNIAVILFIEDPMRYPTASSAYTEAKKYFGSYLWVAILVGLAIVGFVLGVIVPDETVAAGLANLVDSLIALTITMYLYFLYKDLKAAGPVATVAAATLVAS
jgi:hypothetical protein